MHFVRISFQLDFHDWDDRDHPDYTRDVVHKGFVFTDDYRKYNRDY